MQKKVIFKSNKGYLLRGVLHIPRGKGPFPAVIVQHGFKSNYDDFIIKDIAQNLEKDKFIVLRFNLSGHKSSGGSYKEVLVSQFIKDEEKAINFLLRQSKVDKSRLGMVGHSMGAFTALICANKFKKYFKAVVSIASLYDTKALLKTYFRDNKISDQNKDYWVVSNFKVTAKHFDDRIYLQKKFLINDIKLPVLVIHGTKDKRVQFKDGQKIYSLLKQPKEFKAIQGAGHGFNNKKHENLVVKYTTTWLKKYL